MPDCSSVQRSLAWCQGRPELPGVKRRIYYISKYDILQWPVLQHDANGRLISAAYTGDFVLRADTSWKFIDIISDKSQLTSEAQGEYPSQTQLNKLVAVHPGVEAEASAAAAYLNNNDNVFLVEDMRGAVRVVGSDKWPTKTTVAQDLGQGATGSTSTTINVEATDECPAPFYTGKIVTDDGTFTPNPNPNPATGGDNSSGSGNNSGNSGSGNNSSEPIYDGTVVINGQSRSITKGSTISITGNLTSMKFTGTNMSYLSYKAGNEMETEIEINTAGTSATCNDVITAPKTVKIYREEGTGNNRTDVLWFTINLTSSSSSGGNTGGNTSGGNTSGGNTSGGNTSGGNTSGGNTSGGNTSGGNTSGTSTVVIGNAQYNEAYVNGDKIDPSLGTITVYNTFSSLKVTGVNMSRVALWVRGEDDDAGIPMNADGTEATWGNNDYNIIQAPNTIDVYAGSKKWFTINVVSGSTED
nr:hypothetical protein [Prevotella sp. P6B1]